jgi:hypothetical protein
MIMVIMWMKYRKLCGEDICARVKHKFSMCFVVVSSCTHYTHSCMTVLR